MIAPAIRREALPEQIIHQLIGLVKAGHVKPGERLPAERRLAAELGVGRPTLREALRALQLLGILDVRHGDGVFVAGLDTILEARKVIEGAVLASVARTIDARAIGALGANLAQLEKLVAQSRKARVDAGRVNALAEEFRAIIAGAIANPILTRALRSLDLLSAATRQDLMSAGPLGRVLASHRRIVAALRRHDSAAARRALEAYIDTLGKAGARAPRRKTRA